MESDRMIALAKESVEVKPEDVLSKEQYLKERADHDFGRSKEGQDWQQNMFNYRNQMAQQRELTHDDLQKMAQAQQQTPYCGQDITIKDIFGLGRK